MIIVLNIDLCISPQHRVSAKCQVHTGSCESGSPVRVATDLGCYDPQVSNCRTYPSD